MAELTQVFGTLARDALAQTTVILAAGLLVARYIRLPARGHAVLTMAFIAALVTPLASGIVRQGGWGILAPLVPAEKPSARVQATMMPSDDRARVARRLDPAAIEDTPKESVVARRADSSFPQAVPDASLASEPAKTSNEAGAVQLVFDSEAAVEESRGAVPWGTIVLAAAWLAASLIAVVRLARGVLGSGRLMATAEPCSAPSVAGALAVAREGLGLPHLSLDVFQSPTVRCPVIWCWSRRPRLVLPAEAVRQWSTGDWTPILCHELAHWKRRDHVTALAAELACCAMPWQPLAWWAKRRLEQTSEQACDDWAVSAGHSATDYAETLLGLVAQPGSPLQLAALRRKSALGGRIRHILTQSVPRPRLGRAWGLAVLIATVAIISATALCQRGVARAESAPLAPEAFVSAKPADASTDTAKQSAASDQPQRYKAHGRVLAPDGQPVADAEVTWEVTYRGKPRVYTSRKPVVQTKTDAEGRFSCEAELVENDLIYAGLVIRAAGYGLRGRATPLPKLDKPLEIQLDPSEAIEGTIFTPNGEPVKEARVFVFSVVRHAEGKTTDEAQQNGGWYLSISPDDLKTETGPSYWPQPAVTDENGHFVFNDIVPQSASAELIVLAKDFAKTHVNVSRPDAPHYPGDNRTWREPKFTLVLEDPYVVDGQFVDEKTGRGIPGVHITVGPMSNSRGGHGIDRIDATSDNEGRYTLRAGSADSYWVEIRPPLGYAGLDVSPSAKEIERIAKGRKVNYDFKLRPGVVLRGRVVAADTGDPVPDVDVVYRPERNRKLGANSEFSPVKTAADGTFELTGADGKGFLLVDAPDKGFYRLAVDDKRAQKNYEVTYPHGLVEIDVPAEGQAEPYVVALHRGRELVVRALDPSGKPVKQLASAFAEQGLDRYFSSEDRREGTFRINAAEPGRTYRVFLFSADAMAGIVTELAAPEDGRVLDVRLEPCATIRGRYVYDGGAPAPQITNFPHFSMSPEKDEVSNDNIFNLPFYDNFARHPNNKRVSDADGAFELSGIVPGVFMYLSLNYRFSDGKLNREVGTLKPGEVKDLGDVVIQAR